MIKEGIIYFVDNKECNISTFDKYEESEFKEGIVLLYKGDKMVKAGIVGRNVFYTENDAKQYNLSLIEKKKEQIKKTMDKLNNKEQKTIA